MRVLFSWYEWVLRRLAPKGIGPAIDFEDPLGDNLGAEGELQANYEKAYGDSFFSATLVRRGRNELWVWPREAVLRLTRSARAGRFVP